MADRRALADHFHHRVGAGIAQPGPLGVSLLGLRSQLPEPGLAGLQRLVPESEGPLQPEDVPGQFEGLGPGLLRVGKRRTEVGFWGASDGIPMAVARAAGEDLAARNCAAEAGGES